MITVFFVGSNSINPTYTVLYDELRRRREPDLRVVDVATTTPERIAELARTSDVVTFDNFIKVADKLEPDTIASVILDEWRGSDFYRAVWEAVTGSGTPVLYVASGWDLHWPGPVLEEVLSRIHAIAWMFEKQPLTLSDIPFNYRDPWMGAHGDPLVNWRTVRERIPVRVELIHSLAAEEFRKRRRRAVWGACIAGDGYATRQIAQESARQAGVRLAPFRRLDSLILARTQSLARFIPPTAASRLRNRLRWANQRFLVAASRVNFVCGSGYRYPVRKFFEVPAGLSALICYPATGFSDYGFVDGTNAVVTMPEDFGRAARLLLADGDRWGRLVRNGFELVRRLHSAERRADDLLACLRRMRAGRLRTAEFVRGEFAIA